MRELLSAPRIALLAAIGALLGYAAIAAGAPEPAAAVTDCSMTPPANQTASTSVNQAGAVVTYPAPTTTGSCGTITCSPPSGSFYPIGTTLATCTATTSPPAKASFTIRVNDTQAPALTVSPNVTVGNDPGVAGAVVTYAAPVGTDNAPGVFVFCSAQSGSLFPLGTTTVTCFARDTSENTTFKTFDVTVNDTEAPDTEIDGAPARKSRSGKALFRFDSDDPKATFECQLDAAAFEPCGINQALKVKRGKHTLLVRAVDRAGNVDATPATWTWKVKKKRNH